MQYNRDLLRKQWIYVLKYLTVTATRNMCDVLNLILMLITTLEEEVV